MSPDICAWLRRDVWAGMRVSIARAECMDAEPLPVFKEARRTPASSLLVRPASKEARRTLATLSRIGRRMASLWRQMGPASRSHTPMTVLSFGRIRSQRPRCVWCVVPQRSCCLRCTRVCEAAGMCGAGHCVGTLAVDMLRTACMCGERSTGALVAKSVPLTCRMIMTFFRKVRRAVDDRPTHR